MSADAILQTDNRADESSAIPGPQGKLLSIFLISVLGLFVELLLIRWIGTEIRIFAYLQNTILIVCFLGLGIGCFTSQMKISMQRSIAALMILTLILAIPYTRNLVGLITHLLTTLSDFVIWEEAIRKNWFETIRSLSVGLTLTFLLMILVWEIFVPMGRILGRLMNDTPETIKAYSVNVAGSLIGIWLFVLMSGFSLPPFVWMTSAGLLFLAYLGKGSQRTTSIAMLVVAVIASWTAGTSSSSLESKWSPYQKLVAYQNENPSESWKGNVVINVNNVGYQGIVDLSETGVERNPTITPEMANFSQYNLPTLFKPNPKNVLIVGAGSGNDVAGALRGNSSRVTAVDIDPVIIDMGRKYHPERPYQSDRVTVVNDDARSFFATTQEKYDLIIFGLLDSHTMTSMTNARLDHYVYTRESLEHAKSLLTQDGVISLNFMAHRPFIADRIGSCLTEVFGRKPIVFVKPTDPTGWGGVMFITGNQDVIAASLSSNELLQSKIEQWQARKPVLIDGKTKLATDDWPYLYLESPTIPTLYFLIAVLMFAMLGYAKLRCPGTAWFGRWQQSQWHFFFLGAAFLLLEVQNISKASVVLGNTWIVNAVIISGILMMVLLANVIAAFVRIPQGLVAGGLIGTCLTLYFVDLSSFGFLPFSVKAPLVGGLTTLPMLFSGILFINSFANCEHKGEALGANLIGSLVGGILQAVTFLVGLKALLLIVAGLYIAALFTRPKEVANTEDSNCDSQDDSRGANDDLESTGNAENQEQDEPTTVIPNVGILPNAGGLPNQVS